MPISKTLFIGCLAASALMGGGPLQAHTTTRAIVPKGTPAYEAVYRFLRASPMGKDVPALADPRSAPASFAVSLSTGDTRVDHAQLAGGASAAVPLPDGPHHDGDVYSVDYSGGPRAQTHWSFEWDVKGSSGHWRLVDYSFAASQVGWGSPP